MKFQLNFLDFFFTIPVTFGIFFVIAFKRTGYLLTFRICAVLETSWFVALVQLKTFWFCETTNFHQFLTRKKQNKTTKTYMFTNKKENFEMYLKSNLRRIEEKRK